MSRARWMRCERQYLRVRRKPSSMARACQKIAKTMKTKSLTINPQRRIMPADNRVGVLCGNRIINSWADWHLIGLGD